MHKRWMAFHKQQQLYRWGKKILFYCFSCARWWEEGMKRIAIGDVDPVFLCRLEQWMYRGRSITFKQFSRNRMSIYDLKEERKWRALWIVTHNDDIQLALLWLIASNSMYRCFYSSTHTQSSFVSRRRLQNAGSAMTVPCAVPPSHLPLSMPHILCKS